MMSNETMEFTVHTNYREFDNYSGIMRLFCQTKKINAVNKEAAKAIAWKCLSMENPNRIFDSQNARKSHRK